ncbi:MAG: hypothetical protein FJ358_02040 [Thaumarchaeota archaeon]|nr:hypothetical protein [Nitrososphaerota archaeon]
MVESAVVYGLSTEGYQIASSLVANKIKTIIIDETLQQAIEFTQDIAKNYKSAKYLLEEEPLLGLRSMEESISDAAAIFFAPKIRKFDDPAMSEIASKLNGLAKNVAKGSIFFYNLPLGRGGNAENFEIIERASGLKADEDLTYIFAPLWPKTNNAVSAGSNSLKDPKKAAAMMKNSGIKVPQILSIAQAELHFAKEVIMRYSPLASELEACRAVADADERKEFSKALKNSDTFVDDLSDAIFDLRTVSAPLETGEPLLYLASGTLRAVEGYVRYVTDEIKNLMKKKSLKASKTSISIAWSFDRYEVRGEKMHVYDLLIERLSDYVGYVVSPPSYEKASGTVQVPVLSRDKTNLVVACSKGDSEALSKGSRNADLVIMRADLACTSN